MDCAMDGVLDTLRAASRVPGVSDKLAALLERFRHALYLPSTAHVELALGAVAANFFDTEPVWLLLVAPPSAGKTVALDSLLDVPSVYEAAVLTESSLLSGTPKRDAKGAKGGLLRAIAGFGILIVKDFTSMLSMHRDTRGPLLAALREVYDGRWTRHIGSDGGRTLHWTGKVGLVGGCTEAYDLHHAVIATLGDRFLLHRLPAPDASGRQTLAQYGASRPIPSGVRAELRERVRELLEAVPRGGQAELPPPETRDLIAALADVASSLRSAVDRDPYRREVEHVPGRELPTRLARQLATLYTGLSAIGVTDARARELLIDVACSCVPPLRLAAAAALLQHEEVGTRALATALGRPTVVVRRALEDLACHGLAYRAREGAGQRGDLYARTSTLDQLCVSGFRLYILSKVRSLVNVHTKNDD